jgi:hypothetical protein
MKKKILNFLSFLIPAATGLWMLLVSWRKWPDIITDFGRELYVPWQITNGQVLYRDMSSLFGPLPPYLHALLFKLFGVSLSVVAYFNIFLTVVLSAAIFYFFEVTIGRLAAVVASTAFLGLFAFAEYTIIGNYNYVCPYTYTLTHGIIISFLTFLLFLSYVKKGAKVKLFFIGAGIGLVFLCKPEVFFALATAIGSGLFLEVYLRRSPARSYLRICVSCSAGFLSVLAIPVIYFTFQSSFKESIKYLLLPYEFVRQSVFSPHFFYKVCMGTDKLLVNAQRMFLTAMSYFLLWAMIWVSFGDARSSFKRILNAVLLGCGLLCSVIAVRLITFSLFRGMPCVMVVLAVCFLLALLRHRFDQGARIKYLPLLAMAVFSLILMFKIFFAARIHQLGFALAMPAVLLAFATLVGIAPGFAIKRKHDLTVARIMFCWCIGIVILECMGLSGLVLQEKKIPVGSRGDTIIDYPESGIYVSLALEEIARLTTRDESLVVFPEGVMINYLSRRKNPTPFYTFMPVEMGLFREEKILASFQENPPDYVVFVDYQIQTYGYAHFCEEYGGSSLAWFNKNYSTCFTAGPKPFTESGFGVVIARRNSGN